MKRSLATTCPMPLLRNRNEVSFAIASLLLAIGSLAIIGCSASTPTAESTTNPDDEIDDLVKSAAELAAAGKSPDVGSETFQPSRTPLPNELAEDLGNYEISSGGMPKTRAAAPAPTPRSPDTGDERNALFELADPSQMRAEIPNATETEGDQRELRKDFDPQTLVRYLQNADLDMRQINSGKSGLTDRAEVMTMMHRVATLKSEASIQLQNHPDATEKEKALGHRGQLQALSYLASTGDLASAKALRSLAESNLESSDADLVMESRIVMIGFALDELQAGEKDAAKNVVDMVNQLTPSDSSDVPAILILGQARQMLSNYGQFDEAAAVRSRIKELYGNSPDAMIARIAAQAAGSAKFDVANRLLVKIIETENVALARWTDAATELITESPDMNVVQHLASAALQLEAANRPQFVEETFAVLREQLDDLDSATAREADTAWQAHLARKEIVGRVYDMSRLPTVGGTGIDRASYKDKLILMPFWTVSIPGSLQIIGLVKQIQQSAPEQIGIIGMNLDPEAAPLEELMASAKPDFPSYRSVSSPTAKIANPTAAAFGLVSFPFVAILDSDNRVLALDFTGRDLEAKVQRLLQDRPD